MPARISPMTYKERGGGRWDGRGRTVQARIAALPCEQHGIGQRCMARTHALTRAASASFCTAAHQRSSLGRPLNTVGQPKCLGRISAKAGQWIGEDSKVGVGVGQQRREAYASRLASQPHRSPLRCMQSTALVACDQLPHTCEEDEGGEQRGIAKADLRACTTWRGRAGGAACVPMMDAEAAWRVRARNQLGGSGPDNLHHTVVTAPPPTRPTATTRRASTRQGRERTRHKGPIRFVKDALQHIQLEVDGLQLLAPRRRVHLLVHAALHRADSMRGEARIG